MTCQRKHSSVYRGLLTTIVLAAAALPVFVATAFVTEFLVLLDDSRVRHAESEITRAEQQIGDTADDIMAMNADMALSTARTGIVIATVESQRRHRAKQRRIAYVGWCLLMGLTGVAAWRVTGRQASEAERCRTIRQRGEQEATAFLADLEQGGLSE